jgi:hypothetical protein
MTGFPGGAVSGDVGGRPDAVGSYPAVTAVHVIDGREIFATVHDGYVVFDGKTLTSKALAGYMESAVRSGHRVANTRRRIFPSRARSPPRSS